METNIEKIQISKDLDIKKYWKENSKYNNENPELGEMVNRFQDMEEKWDNENKFINILSQSFEINKSNIELKKLKNTLEKTV